MASLPCLFGFFLLVHGALWLRARLRRKRRAPLLATWLKPKQRMALDPLVPLLDLQPGRVGVSPWSEVDTDQGAHLHATYTTVSTKYCQFHFIVALTQDLSSIINMTREIHNRISMFRADAGLSRRELADAVGVNPQTIGFLERGDYKPSLELALSIAEVFGVSVEVVFSFKPFPSLSQTFEKGGA